jgi:hypothetical protein
VLRDHSPPRDPYHTDEGFFVRFELLETKGAGRPRHLAPKCALERNSLFHLTRIISITRYASFYSTLTTKRDRRKNVAAKQTLEYGGLYHEYYHFYNPCLLRGGRFYEGQMVASARARADREVITLEIVSEFLGIDTDNDLYC